MKVWGLWYGGCNYRIFDQFNKKDIQEFPSIRAARDDFEDKLRNRDGYTPCVDHDAEMWLCFHNPYQDGDLYPDQIIKIGPRGGIKIERHV